MTLTIKKAVGGYIVTAQPQAHDEFARRGGQTIQYVVPSEEELGKLVVSLLKGKNKPKRGNA